MRRQKWYLRVFRDNGLTLVLMGLFLLATVGHVLSGHLVCNDERREHHLPEWNLESYLTSGAFQESVAENWESEFLQMFVFVWLTTFLCQRGSPESRHPGRKEAVDADPRSASITSRTPWPVRRGGLILKLYEHSLAIAFLVLFTMSWGWHAYSGAIHCNSQRLLHGEPPMSISAYLLSSRFWFESFQNWQSEFLSVAAMVFLAVYLRQRGSPESKPVATAHEDHGR